MKVRAIQFTGHNSADFNGLGVDARQFGIALRVVLDGVQYMMFPSHWLVVPREGKSFILSDQELQRRKRET